jgi:c-di-GMP-binding flagellar brake protein YcgR
MEWHEVSKKSSSDNSSQKEMGVFRNLLEAKTMLAKRDFVSTGILTYAEGDIFEVEISEWQLFHLGDKIKVTMYSRIGIHTFESTVIAKDSGGVMFINPPELQRKFMDKRQHQRIEVSQVGLIHTIFETPGLEGTPLTMSIPFNITDISLGGVGFVLLPGEREFATPMQVGVDLDLGFVLSTITEIIRKNPANEGIFYGAKFKAMPPEKIVSLRACIFRVQVANHFTQKRIARQSYRF